MSRIVWRKKIEGIFSGTLLFVVEDRIVYMHGFGDHNRVTGLTLTGDEVWVRQYQPIEHSFMFPFQSSLFLDGRMAVSISTTTGEVLGSREFESRVVIQPPSRLGPVYVVGEKEPSRLVGLDPATLECVWYWTTSPEWCVTRGTWLVQRPNDEANYRFARLPELRPVVEVARTALPIATGRRACVTTRDVWCAFGDRVRTAMDLTSGEILWTHADDSDHHEILWSDGENAYGGVTDLSAYRLSDGALIWRRTMPAKLADYTSATKAVGFFRTGKGTVQRIDLRTGEITGSAEIPGEVVGVAALDDHRVVVGTFKVLFCIEFS